MVTNDTKYGVMVYNYGNRMLEITIKAAKNHLL